MSQRKAGVAFILFTVMLDMLALGVIIPVLPQLVEQFEHGDTASAARIYGWFGAVWALMQFLFSPVLGALSDRFGRRPIVLLSCFGLGCDYVVMALAPNVRWLFLGRVVSGLLAASFATALAYMADVTPPAERGAAFGKIGAAWGLGFIAGPALGGVLGQWNPRLPFWFSAALTLAGAAYGLFILPESLPPPARSPRFSWARANPVGSFRLLSSHHELFGLSAVSFLLYFAQNVLPSVYVLYAGYRYNWGAGDVGLALATVGFANIAVQGFLVKPVLRRWGERRTLLTGVVFGAAGYAVYGWAPSGGWFWAGALVFCWVGFYGPAAQQIMTRLVAPSEQGQLQGANSSLMGIAGVLGPPLFTWVFAHFIRPGTRVVLPGAAFLLAAAIVCLALIVALRVTRRAGTPPPFPAVSPTST